MVVYVKKHMTCSQKQGKIVLPVHLSKQQNSPRNIMQTNLLLFPQDTELVNSKLKLCNTCKHLQNLLVCFQPASHHS